MGPLSQYPKVCLFPFPANPGKALAHAAVATGFEGIQPGHKVSDLGKFLQHVILEGFLRLFGLSVGCIHGDSISGGRHTAGVQGTELL